MSKRTRELKQKIHDTISSMDEIVVNGGKIHANDPLMIKLVKLRRELIKQSQKKLKKQQTT